MSRARTSTFAAAFALLAAALAGPVRAGTPVNYGTTELGRIVTGCFTVCFGTNCNASGTVKSIQIDAPYFVRGTRLARTDNGSACLPINSLNQANQTLPEFVGPNQALVFDVDLVPTSAGFFPRTLSINGDGFFDLDAVVNPVDNCLPSSSAMCLQQDGRFKVENFFRAFDGARGRATVVPGTTAESGLFWFFNSDNWEMLIKVLDGCGTNNRFWVFAAATTNVEYTITVTDTETQSVKTYFNPLAKPAVAITDTAAFATCP